MLQNVFRISSLFIVANDYSFESISRHLQEVTLSYTSCNLLLVKVYTAVVPVGGATSQSKEAARTKAADEAERKVLFLYISFQLISPYFISSHLSSSHLISSHFNCVGS